MHLIDFGSFDFNTFNRMNWFWDERIWGCCFYLERRIVWKVLWRWLFARVKVVELKHIKNKGILEKSGLLLQRDSLTLSKIVGIGFGKWERYFSIQVQLLRECQFSSMGVMWGRELVHYWEAVKYCLSSFLWKHHFANCELQNKRCAMKLLSQIAE